MTRRVFPWWWPQGRLVRSGHEHRFTVHRSYHQQSSVPAPVAVLPFPYPATPHLGSLPPSYGGSSYILGEEMAPPSLVTSTCWHRGRTAQPRTEMCGPPIDRSITHDTRGHEFKAGTGRLPTKVCTTGVHRRVLPRGGSRWEKQADWPHSRASTVVKLTNVNG